MAPEETAVARRPRVCRGGMGRYDFIRRRRRRGPSGRENATFPRESRATPPRARSIHCHEDARGDVASQRASRGVRVVPSSVASSRRPSSGGPRRGPPSRVRAPAAADDARSVMFVSFAGPRRAARPRACAPPACSACSRRGDGACTTSRARDPTSTPTSSRRRGFAPTTSRPIAAPSSKPRSSRRPRRRHLRQIHGRGGVLLPRPRRAPLRRAHPRHAGLAFPPIRATRRRQNRARHGQGSPRDPVAEDKTPLPGSRRPRRRAGGWRRPSEPRARVRAPLRLALVCSPVETTLLRDATRPSEKLIPASFFCDPPPREFPTPGFEPRAGFVTIGTFYHPPNVDSVRWMSEEVWPLVVSRFESHHARVRRVSH